MPRDVPPFSRPDRNRRVILTTRPEGVPQADHFALDEAPVPEPQEGELLVRNVYLSVDPAQRGWAADVANYSEPVKLGGPMRALAVGQVVQSRAGGFAEGDFVYGFFGWQDYAAVPASTVLHRCTQDLPLDAFGSVCGINGVTAYLALTRLGRPVSGETLLVSTAAGSVGSFVGQIGKGLGCRTIGLTGSDDKVDVCTGSFGYDAAINYRMGGLGAAIDAAAPEGVNVYYDNTGGDDPGHRAAAHGGRWARGAMRHRLGRVLVAAADRPAQRARDPHPAAGLVGLRHLRLHGGVCRRLRRALRACRRRGADLGHGPQAGHGPRGGRHRRSLCRA